MGETFCQSPRSDQARLHPSSSVRVQRRAVDKESNVCVVLHGNQAWCWAPGSHDCVCFSTSPMQYVLAS